MYRRAFLVNWNLPELTRTECRNTSSGASNVLKKLTMPGLARA